MKRLRSIVVGMLLVLAVAVPVLAVDGVERNIGTEYDVSWGNYAIYENYVALDLNGPGLLVYDISKDEFKNIDNSYNSRSQKSIYGSNLVYYDDRGVILVDINTLESRVISTTGTNPSIYGNKIAYIKNGNVYLYNLLDGSERQLSTSGSVRAETNYIRTAMDADHVVWIEGASGAAQMGLYNLHANVSRALNILPEDIETVWMFHMYENYIVWNRNKTFLYKINDADPTSESYEQINDPTVRDSTWGSHIYKNKVVFDTNTPDVDWADVWVYDINTKVLSQLNSTLDNWNPVTNGDKIIYPNNCCSNNGFVVFDITSPREETYSLNATANTVTVINPYKTDDPTTTGIDERVVATIPTGAGPSDSALSPDETKLYILNSTAKTVTVAQTYDFVPINTVNINPTNKQTATAVAGDNDSNTYVALKSSTGAGVVKKITSAGIETTLTVGVNPNGLKISPDNKKLLASNGSSSNVTAIDLATFTIIEGNIITDAGPKLVKP